MDRISGEEIKSILSRAEKRLAANFELEDVEYFPGDSFSREYKTFRRDSLEKYVSKYEKFSEFSSKIIKIKPKEKEREKLQAAIDIAHLDLSIEGVTSFAVLVSLFGIVSSLLLGIIWFYFAGETVGFFTTEGLKVVNSSVYFIPLALIIFSALLLKPLTAYPIRIANRWRLKASNQMVLCILYMVMYMRHTSNLEHAIKFAGEHVGTPLALDLRKILWDVEAGKYVTIKESLDNYLEGWRDHSVEFVESMHLIEGSLYEPNEDRRISLLEKALEVILNGTYEKMLHYAHDLRSPITMLYMMGVILPVLGLVIFPLMSGFLEGLVKWWHIAILYNIMLPLFVYFFGIQLLEKRPTGYTDEDILTLYPEFEELTKASLFGLKLDGRVYAFLIGFILVFIGLIPLILFYLGVSDVDILGFKLLDYKCDPVCIGPYGMWSMLLSLFIPLGIAVGLGFYYLIWSRELIKIRKNTKRIEKEFSGAIFQLGNRVADGIPIESAFSNVANSMKGSSSGEFLSIVSINIRKLGMSVKEAIFNRERGALTAFPSALMKSSMKVLIESAKKGPNVVSKSLITISDYVNRVHAIAERLKDLLADIISSMKSQITFLTPMIAGIVVGVTSMMINVINILSSGVSGINAGELGEASIEAGGLEGALSYLNIKDMIPGYQFQIVVGIFVLEVVVILSILSSGIENGLDKINQRNVMAKNLLIAIGLYFIISLGSILVFSVLASGVAQVGLAAAG